MEGTIQQVMKQSVTKQQKRHQLIWVMVCLGVFILVFLLSGVLGYFAVVGYSMGIAVVVIACRQVLRERHTYRYVLDENCFWIYQMVGRKERILLEQPVRMILYYGDLEGLKQFDDVPFSDALFASDGVRHPQNRFVLCQLPKEQRQLVIFTPDQRFDRTFSQLMGPKPEREGQEEADE